MKANWRRLLTAIAMAAPALLADRLTKRWAEISLQAERGGTMDAVSGLFRWRYARNTGMAFSALSDSGAFLVALTACLIAAILFYIAIAPKMKPALLVGLTLVLAGGAGNLWDRVSIGYVIDFIELTFIRFAVFNVADICVCAGAVLSAIAFLLSERRAGA